MKKHPYLNSYIRGVNFPRNRYEIRAAYALKEDFPKDAYVIDGVPYWHSNNQVPPQDILEFWAYCGLPFDLEKATARREEQTEAVLSAYRERMKTYVHSPEEIAEMRAAFGTGVTVVNAITGVKTEL